LIRDIIVNTARFIVLMLLQVLIINEIDLPFYINPQVYLLFLLMLPISTPHYMQLLIGLFAGFVADKFGGTMGMHMAACVFMMYFRYFFIRNSTELDMQQLPIEPGISTMGIKWFMPYSVTMVLLHHTMLFFVEAFTFAEFFSTLLRVINSSAVTLLLILLMQFLFYRNSRRTE
jgi:rod shape-determining protein MreD